MSTELQMVLAVAGVLLAANFIAMALFVLFAKLPHGKFRESIRDVIYHFDRFADNMENAQKRSEAIGQVNEVLGWRRILIPRVLIGWIIDAEVAAIRRMQRVTDTPNLHQEDKTHD